MSDQQILILLRSIFITIFVAMTILIVASYIHNVLRRRRIERMQTKVMDTTLHGYYIETAAAEKTMHKLVEEIKEQDLLDDRGEYDYRDLMSAYNINKQTAELLAGKIKEERSKV